VDPDFVNGSGAAKLRVFGILSVSIMLVAGSGPLFDLMSSYHGRTRSADAFQALKHAADRTIFVACVSAVTLCAWSTYIFSLALRARRAGRWPPPGMRPAFRTRIRAGQRYPTLILIVGLALVGVSIGEVLVGLHARRVLYRLASDFDSPNPHIQLTPNDGAADVRR
jgi:hypothetical protein